MLTLDQGVQIARAVEAIIQPLFAHCALGGSLLHAGASTKDCDIFIYPHDKRKGYSDTTLLAELFKAGFADQKESNPDYVDKHVVKCKYNGIRVDLIFL